MAVSSIAVSQRPVVIRYSSDIEAEIQRISDAIVQSPQLAQLYNPRWLAIQLLEGHDELLDDAVGSIERVIVDQALQQSRARLQNTYGEDVDVALADHRYQFVHDLVRQTVTHTRSTPVTLSDRIDRLVTHRVWGVPIFLALMWVAFKMTADVSAPYLDWIDAVISGPITAWASAALTLVGLGGTWVESLVVDGVIAGVGGVLVFVPVLASLYLVLAVLEDSGYMARAAFVMDRLMNVLGLHGKSFLPLIVGFGCTVPALYATRTLENERDRILTGLLAPFMSCGARLPVYVLFAAIFFPEHAGLVIFSMYLLGIVTAIVVGLILRSTLLRAREPSAFLMELPPYRVPSLAGIWCSIRTRTGAFVRNAWTIILAVSVVLWFLLAIPVRGEGGFADTEIDDSLFAAVSSTAAPALEPLGFGTWEASGALLTGFVAKEVVIATMAQIYHVDDAPVVAEPEPTSFLADVGGIVTSFGAATVDTLKSIPLIVGIDLFADEAEPEPTTLMNAVQRNFAASSGGHGMLAGLAFMVFILLYTPCMAAVAAEKQELGTKWTWFSIVGQLLLAWLMAFLIFQGGKLLGLG